MTKNFTSEAPWYVNLMCVSIQYNITLSICLTVSQKFPSKLLKVVLLGDTRVGKSSLINRFVSDKFDAQSFHTIGVEFLNKDVQVDGELYTMQVRCLQCSYINTARPRLYTLHNSPLGSFVIPNVLSRSQNVIEIEF